MRADARRNYERLVATAREAFLEHGADASLDDIAKAAGVGSGTLYRHFPTRDALLNAVVGESAREVAERADALLGEYAPADALRFWLRSLVDYSTTVAGLPKTLLGCYRDPESELNPPCVQIFAALERLLAAAQEAGAIRSDVAAEDVGMLAHGISVATEQSDDPGIADRLLGVAFDGLRPRG